MCDVRSASFFKFSVCDMGQRKGDLLSVMLISSKLELLVINIVLVTKCQLMCQNHIFLLFIALLRGYTSAPSFVACFAQKETEKQNLICWGSSRSRSSCYAVPLILRAKEEQLRKVTWF